MLIENRFIMKDRTGLFISLGVLTFSITNCTESKGEVVGEESTTEANIEQTEKAEKNTASKQLY